MSYWSKNEVIREILGLFLMLLGDGIARFLMNLLRQCGFHGNYV